MRELAKVAGRREFGLNDQRLQPRRIASMHNPVTLLIAAVLTVYLTLDTALILQTGKTPGLFHKYLRYRQRHGPITRKGSPRRFWIYVIANAIALLMCLTYVAWALFSWRS